MIAGPGDIYIRVRNAVSYRFEGALTYYLTVTSDGETNSSPVLANIDPIEVTAGESLAIALSATDDDGDELIFSVSGNPAGSVVSGNTFSWIPSSEDEGVHSITLSVGDGKGGFDSQVVRVTVNVGNRAPQPSHLTSATQEDVSVSVRLQADDADGDQITYLISVQPRHGVATLSGDLVLYAPEEEFSGTDSIGYVATDGLLISETAYVRVSVASVNDRPSIVPTVVEGIEDEIAVVVLRAEDPDGDSLTTRVVAAPSHGQAEIIGMELTYQPSADFSGTDSLLVSVSDGLEQSTAWISFHILPRNDPPTFSDSLRSLSISELDSLAIPLSASDPDGDVLVFSVLNGPEGARVLGRTLTWTPTSLQAGVHQIAVLVQDPSGSSDTLSIQVDVANVNQPPSISVPDTLRFEEATAGTYQLSVSDIDQDDVTVRLLTAPDGLALVGSHISWTPTYADAGEYASTIMATDGIAAEISKHIVIIVRDVNRAPVIDPVAPAAVYVGDTLRVEISANDLDGDPIALELVRHYVGLSMDGIILTWVPDLSQRGSWDLHIAGSDDMSPPVSSLTKASV